MAVYSYRETVYTLAQDGPTLTAAGTNTILSNTTPRYTFPAGYFYRIGQSLKVVATGRISSVITTPGTARFDIRLSNTVIFDGLAVVLDPTIAYANVGWILEVEMTTRSVGQNGMTWWSQGKWTCNDIVGVPAGTPRGALTAILPWNSTPLVSPSIVNSESALILDCLFTQTVATGSLTCHQFKVIAEN